MLFWVPLVINGLVQTGMFMAIYPLEGYRYEHVSTEYRLVHDGVSSTGKTRRVIIAKLTDEDKARQAQMADVGKLIRI